MVLNLLRNNAAILLDGYYAMLAANLSRVKISTNIGPVGVAEKSTHAKKSFPCVYWLFCPWTKVAWRDWSCFWQLLSIPVTKTLSFNLCPHSLLAPPASVQENVAKDDAENKWHCHSYGTTTSVKKLSNRGSRCLQQAAQFATSSDVMPCDELGMWCKKLSQESPL